MKRERVAVFIDGSNVYHIVKRLFPDKRPIDFNFENLSEFLANSMEIVGVYYYNVPLDREKDEFAYVKQQRFFEKIKRLPKFHFVLCRMQKRRVNGKIIYEVKEDDIYLAVDMVRLAHKNEFDTAILISSDGDFVPVIDAVREIGKNVENVGFEEIFSYHLRQKSNKFIRITKEDVESFFD